MIVRILGEGQLDVDDSLAGELNVLDAKLEAAVNSGDEDAFRPALAAMLARVRDGGNTGAGGFVGTVGRDPAVLRRQHGRRAWPALGGWPHPGLSFRRPGRRVISREPAGLTLLSGLTQQTFSWPVHTGGGRPGGG